MSSRLAITCIQSSRRPAVIVQTGRMLAVSPPSTSRRRMPRSTASATAVAWGTVKQTVALTLTPSRVASSMAATPAFVTGSFTWMFGARPAK